MGWARTLLLGEIGNRLDIGDVERDVAILRREIAGSFHKGMSQDEMIRKLISENAELKLYLASLIRLLTAKGQISREELQNLVNSIDAEDGRMDGCYQGDIV
jgi:hypothetical protein